jgi:integrase
MREDEIVHLDEGDIFENPDDDVYEIAVSNKKPGWCRCHPEGWTTKNYRCRRVPVEPETIEAARAFLRTRSESPNFSASERSILASDIGQTLRQARQRLGLNRHAATKVAKIGYRSYCYYEEGATAPTPFNCIKLERALGLAEGTIPRVSRYGTTFSLDQKRIWTEIAEACKDAGIRHFSPHAFRHAWASRMFNAGFGIDQVSKWLGHSDVEVTKRYLGMTDEQRPTAGEIRKRLSKLRARSAGDRPHARRSSPR